MNKNGKYICSYQWPVGNPGQHKTFFVSDVPRHKPGAYDWGWTEKREQAIALNEYWKRRFTRWCRTFSYTFNLEEVGQ